jgi:hypothetical protein
MKTLRELLLQLNENNIFINEEENKGWKYQGELTGRRSKDRAISRRIRDDADAAKIQRSKDVVKTRSAKAKEEEGKASKWGIPYITKMAKGSDQEEGKIVSVSVDGHDDDGKIWQHQGLLHFRHPSGKTHNNVELQKSAIGIAIMPKAKPGQRVVKAVAQLPPSKNAIEDTDFTPTGKTLTKKK